MWYNRPKIVKSWRLHKKLAVLTPKGWVHFGDTRYQDYTQHRDKIRRAAYIARASQIRDKSGRLSIKNPYSPNYWAARILWRY